MTTTKKWLSIILSTAVLFCCMLFGCNVADKPSETAEIALNYTDCVLEVFGTVQLEIENAPEGEPVWHSENAEVVVVNDTGLVEGVSQGTTKVVVTIAGISASCEVTVLENSSIPVILVKGIEKVELLYGDDYTLQPSVTYNCQVFDDGSFTYTIEDESIATVDENGIVTAIALGETTLTIKANWRNYVDSEYLIKSIPVLIKYDATAKIDQQKLVLYAYEMTKNGVDYEGEAQLTYKATDSKKDVDTKYLSWKSSDENVVKVNENGFITAENIGKAEITLIYSNGAVYCESMPCGVEVQKPVVDYTKKKPVLIDAWIDTEAFSVGKTEITYDLQTLFSENWAVTSVSNVTTGANVSYTNGKFVPSELTVGENVWYIENENYTVKTNVIVATKVITTAQELMDIQNYGGITIDTEHPDNDLRHRKWYNYSGYFVLGSDITFTKNDYEDGTKFVSNYYHMTSVLQTEVGFTGIFNGLGYRIYDVSVSTGGLFGNLAKGGFIKNVNIHNAKLNDSWSGVLAHSVSGSIKNCSIEANTNKKQQVAPICFLLNEGKIENVHVTASGVYDNSQKTSGDKNSAVVYWSRGSKSELINVTVNAVETGILIGNDQSKLNGYIIIRGDNNIGDDDISSDMEWPLI